MRISKLIGIFVVMLLFVSVFNYAIYSVSAAGVDLGKSCTTHDQCAQACTNSCPGGSFGCCDGCNLGQCVNNHCSCTFAPNYCASPKGQVGSTCNPVDCSDSYKGVSVCGVYYDCGVDDDGVCTNKLGANCNSCEYNKEISDCNIQQMYCGDGSCNNGETCSSCATDCGTCSGGGGGTPSEPYCGDGSCNNGETCGSCATDCGTCSGGGGGTPPKPITQCTGKDDGSSCDDGNACTIGDNCQSEICTSGSQKSCGTTSCGNTCSGYNWLSYSSCSNSCNPTFGCTSCSCNAPVQYTCSASYLCSAQQCNAGYTNPYDSTHCSINPISLSSSVYKNECYPKESCTEGSGSLTLSTGISCKENGDSGECILQPTKCGPNGNNNKQCGTERNINFRCTQSCTWETLTDGESIPTENQYNYIYDNMKVACGEGLITTDCVCCGADQGIEYSSSSGKYCCNGRISNTKCADVPDGQHCGDGEINNNCVCGTNEILYNPLIRQYCCNNHLSSLSCDSNSINYKNKVRTCCDGYSVSGTINDFTKTSSMTDSCSVGITIKVQDSNGNIINNAKAEIFSNTCQGEYTDSFKFNGQKDIKLGFEQTYDIKVSAPGYLAEQKRGLSYAVGTTIIFTLGNSDLCNADCTINGICSSGCEGYNGCEGLSHPLCSGKPKNSRIENNENTDYVCCNQGTKPKQIITANYNVNNAKEIVTTEKPVLFDGKPVKMVIVSWSE